MSRSDTLYLHIGLPKTASTYLQREIFPTLSQLSYLGIPQGNVFSGPEVLELGPRTLTNCVKRSPLLWDRYGDVVFRDIFGCGPADREPGDVLLSDEGIGRAGSRPLLLEAHLRGLVAEAKEWGFDAVKVLGMFRRQDHWFASHYAQISDRNPRASQEDFEARVRLHLDPAGERFGFGMLLDYSVLIHHIERAVGGANVLMLPFELLVHDPVGFHSEVAAFFGGETPSIGSVERARKRNVRSTSDNAWELRFARRTEVVRLRPSRLFSSLGLPTEVHLSWRTRGGSIRMTEELSTLVLREYEVSNQSLAETLGLDLDPYGYFPSQ